MNIFGEVGFSKVDTDNIFCQIPFSKVDMMIQCLLFIVKTLIMCYTMQKGRDDQ